jgi:hypothetical protein
MKEMDRSRRNSDHLHRQQQQPIVFVAASKGRSRVSLLSFESIGWRVLPLCLCERETMTRNFSDARAFSI